MHLTVAEEQVRKTIEILLTCNAFAVQFYNEILIVLVCIVVALWQDVVNLGTNNGLLRRAIMIIGAQLGFQLSAMREIFVINHHLYDIPMMETTRLLQFMMHYQQFILMMDDLKVVFYTCFNVAELQEMYAHFRLAE